MDALIYAFASGLVTLIQALPLPAAARLGRLLGGLTFYLSGRYRRVAVQNLTLCLGNEKSPAEIIAMSPQVPAMQDDRPVNEYFLLRSLRRGDNVTLAAQVTNR